MSIISGLVSNWSLRKLLSSEKDSLEKAKAQILYIVLLFTLIKVIVVILVAWQASQIFQLQRGLVLGTVYCILLKLLVTHKRFHNFITHTLVCSGLIIIWSNSFLYAQTINILTLQFLFMLMLSSFYLLHLRLAVLYSILACIPVVVHLLWKHQPGFELLPSHELASPGFEILAVLNFTSIIITHYLFRKAFIASVVEREKLNQQLKQAVKDANQAAESKANFLSAMSHELRTPLNAVIGISELMMGEAYNDEQKENLEILKLSANNLHSLINDILDFSKLDSDKLRLEEVPVDLAKLFTDLSSSLSFQARQKGIEYILDIDEELIGCRVLTDPTRISQIIYNLAGNALKFTEEGNITVRLETLHLDLTFLSLRISIADTGIGISKEQEANIFMPFTQASSSITRNFGGTGLGLAIVKSLLSLFKTSIQLDSTPGEGSTFSFELRLKLDHEEENILAHDSNPDFDLEKMRILVAEDNAMNRILLAKIFSRWNCSVTFALNGKEAIEHLGLHSFDVILMDLHMPVMDGYEAARLVRSLPDTRHLSIPIIALTSSVSGNIYDKVKSHGMDDFLLKPFKLQELYSKLKENTVKV